ncbi:MAG: hypothetical protein ACYTG4_15490 [Planctomycetota bacterium]
MRPLRRVFGLIPILSVALSIACAGGGAAPPDSTLIDNESFVATYVALRVAALTGDDRSIDEEGREAVLREQGVSEEDLLAFVEFHGDDVDFMREIWDEVERRLDAQRSIPEDGPGR